MRNAYIPANQCFPKCGLGPIYIKITWGITATAAL